MPGGKGDREGLRARTVLERALSTYRQRWPVVAGLAFVVFGLTSALSVSINVRLGGTASGEAGLIPAIAATVAIVVTSPSSLGLVFYAGILDHVVAEHQHGDSKRDVHEIVRTLPIGQLLLANVLLGTITALGYLLLVVPGIIAFTRLCLVGPLVNIEGQGATAALRRSAELVRPHFWIVLALVWLPVTAEHWIIEAIEHALLGDDDPFVEAFLVNGIIGVVIGSIGGLVEVTIAHELVRRDRAAARSVAG